MSIIPFGKRKDIIHEKLIRLTKTSLPVEYSAEAGLLFWRERILFAIYLAAIVVGSVSLISSAGLAFHNGYWYLAVAYFFAYLCAVVITLTRRIPFHVRAWFGLVMFYALGLLALLTGGPIGSGRLWLLSLSMVAVLLLGQSVGLLTLVLNATTLLLMGWLMSKGLLVWPVIDLSLRLWVVGSATFVFLNTVVTVSMAILFRGLEEELRKEKKLAGELAESNEKSSAANEHLQQEIVERELTENALRKSEQEFRLTFETAKDAIIWADPETGLITNCNKAAEILVEKDRADIIGHNQTILHPPEKSEHYAEMFRRHLQEKGSADDEAEVITASGKIVPVHITASVASVAGRPIIQGMFRDITEQKRAQKSLKESEHRYRMVIEEAKDIICTVDMKTGIITNANSFAAEILGYKYEQVVNRVSFIELVHPDDHERLFGRLKELAFNKNRKPNFPVRLLKADGSHIDAEINGSIVLDAKGEPETFVGVIRDVTERNKAEEALRESEKRYSTTLNAVPDMVYELALDGRILYANESASKILGIALDNIAEISLLDLLDEEGLETASREIQRILETKERSRSVVYNLRARNGKIIPVEAHASLLERKGQAPTILGVARDISERRRADEALRESERRYRLLAENVKDIIWTLDLQTLCFTYISPSVEGMRGYTVEEAMSQTLDQALTPASLEIVTKALAEQLSPENLEQLGQFWSRTIETEQTRKAGPPKRFEVSVTFIRDLNGKPVELLGVTRDITERRKAEKLIRESERKYRTLFEESRDVVFTATPEGRIADINPAGIELFGYSSREDILNVEIGQGTYVNPADRESYRKEMEERGFVKDHELVLKTKDGKQLFVLVTANAVRDDQGRIAAYKGIMRDITDKKQLEHQLIQAQKMESIGTLAGGIAHDFNNLLAGILGYASLTKTKIPSEHQVFHYIDTIEKSATRAAELTSQLLAFARGGKYESKPIELNGIIKETLKIIGSTFEKSIEIDTHLIDSLPTVEADAGQLQQVLMNLCVNARDAMPDGGKLIIETSVVHLTEDYARTHAGAEPGLYVNLSVTDTGLGMDKATMVRIFEPFFTTKEKGKGTGLGLAMVYGVVKNHGGYVNVYSEPGEGSTFKVYLPVSGKPELQALPEDETLCGGRELILVVDDEETVRSLARDMLESHGYRVLLAESGEKSIEILRASNNSIDLVILDMVMPKMGGRDTFLKLKELNPQVRALLSTGYSQNGKAKEILDSGVMGFLQKPYHVSGLLSKVRAVLDGRMEHGI